MKSRRDMCLYECLCTLTSTSVQIEEELNMNKECDTSWEFSYTEVLYMYCHLQPVSVIHMYNTY